MKYVFKKANSFKLLQRIKIIDGLFIEMQLEHRQPLKVGYLVLFLAWSIQVQILIKICRLRLHFHRHLHSYRHHRRIQQHQRHRLYLVIVFTDWTTILYPWHIIQQSATNQRYHRNLRQILATRYKPLLFSVRNIEHEMHSCKRHALYSVTCVFACVYEQRG